MQIRLLTSFGGSWPDAGTVMDMDDAKARSLILTGRAEKVTDDPPVQPDPDQTKPTPSSVETDNDSESTD